MVFRLYWKQAGDRQNMIIRQLTLTLKIVLFFGVQ